MALTIERSNKSSFFVLFCSVAFKVPQCHVRDYSYDDDDDDIRVKSKNTQ